MFHPNNPLLDTLFFILEPSSMPQLKLIYFFPELRVPSSKLKDSIIKKKKKKKTFPALNLQTEPFT